MIYGAISRRYASALLGACEDKEITSTVVKQFEVFHTAWTESRELRNTLTSPTVPKKTRKEIVLKLAAKIGIHEYLKNFLILLVEKGRMESLGMIFLTLKEMADRREGIIRGEITSAFPLEPFQLDYIRSSLERKTGKKIIVTEQMDSDLIGGVIIKIEDKIIDGSIKSHLNELRKTIVGEINP